MRQSGDLKLTPLRFILAVTLLITASLFLLGCYSASSRQRVGVSVEYASDDYAVLAAYGEWVDYGPYGTVWRPYVVSSWQPFYYGHWVWTGYEWAWVSYEPYGWLVYHYGYWDYQPGFGWFWIPGNTWSSAQVQWVIYGDYIGWTPLPPPGVSRTSFYLSADIQLWNVVEIKNFTRENVGKYRVSRLAKRERSGEQFISDRAPDIQLVEKRTRHSVPTVKIERQSVKMQNEEFHKEVLTSNEEKKVDKYRPEVERKVLKKKKTGQEQDKGSEKKKSGKKKNSEGRGD